MSPKWPYGTGAQIFASEIAGASSSGPNQGWLPTNHPLCHLPFSAVAQQLAGSGLHMNPSNISSSGSAVCDNSVAFVLLQCTLQQQKAGLLP